MSRLTTALRKPVVPVAVGVALTAMLASGVAWTVTGKTATLTVDGQSRSVDFRGSSVADVLDAAGLSAGAHDLLVPAATASVDDGATVALRRGRQLELVVDGKPRTVWVTASSVDEALQQVGLRGQALALSASRSRELPLGGFRLAVTTPKVIRIDHDGASDRRTTTAATVGAALLEAGITLDGDDRLSHPLTRPVVNTLLITVTRISSVRAVEDVVLPYATERRPDATMTKGDTKVLTAGKTGTARRTVVRTYADGALEKTAVASTAVVTAPVTRVLAVGTKARAATSTGGSTSSSARQSTGGADSLNWPALANCESGGNPRAVSSSGAYRGLYQFSFSTWRGVGGSGDPIDASPSEQTYRAKVLFNRSGSGQWPVCGKYLYT